MLNLLKGPMWRAVSLVPLVGLAGAGVFIAVSCDTLLTNSLSDQPEPPGMLPLFLASGLFLLVSLAVAALHVSMLERRFSGPRDRLIRSIERVRSGDVSFRVHVRRTDELRDLAEEFNRLLEWLNQNPPPGVQTGSDLVDVDANLGPVEPDEDPGELLASVPAALSSMELAASSRETSP